MTDTTFDIDEQNDRIKKSSQTRGTEDFAAIIDPPKATTMLSEGQLRSGPPIDPITRVLVYDAAEWEKFVEEWVSHCLKPKYTKVLRFSGAGDKGIDIAGFADAGLLAGVWDNYQCKHYNTTIPPSVAWPDIGKILWYSFTGAYKPPRAYYFIAPRGTGTTLTQLLSNAPSLKQRVKEVWDKNIKDAITDTQPVALDGAFATFVDEFDFSIFKPISIREVIEQHRTSPYFIPRFGGGLPPRPTPSGPPDEIDVSESGYVSKLLDAYADHTKEGVPDVETLKKWKPLSEHFSRQRECFYHAESFRVFVRDKVEPGTFEGLQEEVYQGVVDTCGETHADGLACVNAVMQVAQTISLDAHPLGPSAYVRDRRGICHQLANEDKLKWTK